MEDLNAPTACECEHIGHMDKPNADTRHVYGDKFYAVHQIQTIYGFLIVCEVCAHDCHGAR